MTQNSPAITRREALKQAVLLLGGAASAAQLGALESALAAEDQPRFLSGERLAMLERIVDLIIPETDTPGAVSAGVHNFIDLMLDGWASAGTQQQFVAGFDAIDARAQAAGMPNFIDGSPEQQLALLTQLDREAFAEGSTDEFFRRMKKLVLFSYFSSEPGATEALRFDRVPGQYQPCMSLEDDQRAWFWLGYSYEL